MLGKPGSKPKEQTLVCSICRCSWCKRPSKAKVKPPTRGHGDDVPGTGRACPALAGPSHLCTPVFPTSGSTHPEPSPPKKRPRLSRVSALLPGCVGRLEAWASLSTGLLRLFSLPSSHVLPLAKSPPATVSSSSPTVFTFILSSSSSEWPLCAPHLGDETGLAPGLTDLMAERMDRAHWEIARRPELRILRQREVKGPNPMAGL